MAKNKTMSLEKALAKLESIVESIEQGQIGLEDSIQRFEEGMSLIQRCRSILSEAEQRIQKLQLDSDGTLQPEPFDADASDDAETDAP